LSFNRFMRILMTPLLAGPRRCRVQVGAEHLYVTMGAGAWAFAALIPRASILRVAPDTRRVGGWGAHGWRGRWLVNGSSRGMVCVDIDPPARASCFGFPIKLRQLRLSLEDPERFVTVVPPRAY